MDCSLKTTILDIIRTVVCQASRAFSHANATVCAFLYVSPVFLPFACPAAFTLRGRPPRAFPRANVGTAVCWPFHPVCATLRLVPPVLGPYPRRCVPARKYIPGTSPMRKRQPADQVSVTALWRSEERVFILLQHFMWLLKAVLMCLLDNAYTIGFNTHDKYTNHMAIRYTHRGVLEEGWQLCTII